MFSFVHVCGEDCSSTVLPVIIKLDRGILLVNCYVDRMDQMQPKQIVAGSRTSWKSCSCYMSSNAELLLFFILITENTYFCVYSLQFSLLYVHCLRCLQVTLNTLVHYCYSQLYFTFHDSTFLFSIMIYGFPLDLEKFFASAIWSGQPVEK